MFSTAALRWALGNVWSRCFQVGRAAKMRGTQHAAQRTENRAHSIEHRAHSVQSTEHRAHSVQSTEHTAEGTQGTLSMQHTAHSTQHTAHGKYNCSTQHAACSARHMAQGIDNREAHGAQVGGATMMLPVLDMMNTGGNGADSASRNNCEVSFGSTGAAAAGPIHNPRRLGPLVWVAVHV